MSQRKFVIIGGGAAGIFAAVTAARVYPDAEVIVLEKTNQLLAKVRISGGGRCNVTHDCFDPRRLVDNYPRGNKELLGPFTKFGPKETFEWFESRGATLKIEKDGRCFPITDQSQTIIDTLLEEGREHNVAFRLQQKIESFILEDRQWKIRFKDQETLHCDRLLLATGSSSQGWQWLRSLNHRVVPPVPSLFTFHAPQSPLKELSGISVEDAAVSLKETPFSYRGPLLITHFGFSGPAILKLSAWGALFLHERNYKAAFTINWLPGFSAEKILLDLKKTSAEVSLLRLSPFPFSRNLWKMLISLSGIDPQKPLKDISNKLLCHLAHRLHHDEHIMDGKTMHKEEFVTAGGIQLDEINFKTMESRLQPGLFFAGEILNIDGITGGFNFQNAWTTGWLAGHGMGSN